MSRIVSENWVNAFEFYGWQDEIEIKGSMEQFHQMVIWINDNINNPEDNVFWTYAHTPVFRFRKSKDQMLFILRWS